MSAIDPAKVRPICVRCESCAAVCNETDARTQAEHDTHRAREGRWLIDVEVLPASRSVLWKVTERVGRSGRRRGSQGSAPTLWAAMAAAQCAVERMAGS